MSTFHSNHYQSALRCGMRRDQVDPGPVTITRYDPFSQRTIPVRLIEEQRSVAAQIAGMSAEEKATLLAQLMEEA